MCEAYTQSELKFGKKGALGEKTRTFGPSENTKYEGIIGLRTKVHRWCETQVLIGWNFLVSHHDKEYNFVLTPCYQSPLCFTCSILAYSSKTLN